MPGILFVQSAISTANSVDLNIVYNHSNDNKAPI